MWLSHFKLFFTSIIIGIFLGLSGATAAHYFRSGIQFVENTYLIVMPTTNNFLMLICSLSLAGLLVTLLKSYFKIDRWHGPPDTIFAAHRTDNELDLKKGVLSTLAAFTSAAGGASVGQYGPLVHFGAVLGAGIKHFFRLKISTDIFLGGGVAAAISAGFNAPLAGILFAHEAILRHMSLKALAPISVAAGTAYAVHNSIWDSTAPLLQPYSNNNFLPMIIISLISGPFFGIVSIVFMRSIIYFSKIPARLGLPDLVILGIAVLSLSIIGTYVPEVMGLGTKTIISLSNSNTLFFIAIVILAAKIIATSVSLGFGFFGGVFSPALLIGAAAGAAATALISQTGLYNFEGGELVICGMAAVTGAVIGAPLSMIIIVLELTGSYGLALTSTVGIVTATMISNQLYATSIFDRQLKNRGIDISQGRLGLRLMEEEISSIISDTALTFSPKTKVLTATAAMVKYQHNEAYLVDEHKIFLGKLHLGKLTQAQNNDLLKGLADKTALSIKSDASLQQAIEAASNFIGETIPVIERETGRFLGSINEGDIFKLYLKLQGQTQDLERR